MAEIHDNEISTPGGTYADPLAPSPLSPTASDALGGTGATGAGGYPGSGGTTTTTSTTTTETRDKVATAADQATTEAAGIKDNAASAAADVKQQAAGELANIKDQAKQEARNLTSEAKTRISGQVDNTTSQVASALADLGNELRSMADKSERPDGPATEIVRQLAGRTETISQRLEREGYRGVTDQLSRLGRNKPGLFLVAAGAAGFVVGRMLRNTDTQSLTDAVKGQSSGGNGNGYDSGAAYQAPSTYQADAYATGTTGTYAGAASPAPVVDVTDAPYEAETYAPPLGGTTPGRI
jgi:hypothetical protein